MAYAPTTPSMLSAPLVYLGRRAGPKAYLNRPAAAFADAISTGSLMRQEEAIGHTGTVEEAVHAETIPTQRIVGKGDVDAQCSRPGK